MDVGASNHDTQRSTVAIHDNVPFHPFLPRSVGFLPTASSGILDFPAALPIDASADCHAH